MFIVQAGSLADDPVYVPLKSQVLFQYNFCNEILSKQGLSQRTLSTYP